MGWWWGQEQRQQPTDGVVTPISEAAPVANSGEPTAFEAGREEQMEPLASPETNRASAITLRTRDEQAYEELKTLFAEIDPKRAAQAAARAKEFLTRPKEDYSNSIYASTMSCSQCFDQAYYCSSIGGQLTSIYRYGALRSCSDAWAQWRFCMRTKVMGEDTRQAKIREFNQRRVVKYKTGPSSEDVWEVRKEPVENPFSRSREQ